VSLGRLVARVIVACQWWHCCYGVILELLLRNCKPGVLYKSGIDQSDVDLDWAHVCRQDSAPHVSHVALLLCSFEQAASQNGSDTRQCPLQG
jgi:hypothetical protein